MKINSLSFALSVLSELMLEILNNYPRTRLSVRIIGVIKRQFFHMVTHVFDNSNLSQEIFCNRHLGSCKMLFGTWSQAHAYDPSDYASKRILKPSTYRLQIFLVKDQYLRSLLSHGDQTIAAQLEKHVLKPMCVIITTYMETRL